MGQNSFTFLFLFFLPTPMDPYNYTSATFGQCKLACLVKRVRTLDSFKEMAIKLLNTGQLSLCSPIKSTSQLYLKKN